MPTASVITSATLDDERALSPLRPLLSRRLCQDPDELAQPGKGPSYLKYDLGGDLDGQGRRRGSVAYQLKDLLDFMQAHRTVTGGQR